MSISFLSFWCFCLLILNECLMANTNQVTTHYNTRFIVHTNFEAGNLGMWRY